MPSDDISLDKAGGLVEQTDFIMKQMTQQQLNTLKEFASCLPEKEVKKLTNKTINKYVSSNYLYLPQYLCSHLNELFSFFFNYHTLIFTHSLHMYVCVVKLLKETSIY